MGKKKNKWEKLTRNQFLFLGMASFFFAVLGMLSPLISPLCLYFSIVISGLGLHYSRYCFRKYKSFFTDKIDEADFKDKPYILYLRSFNDDSETGVPIKSSGRYFTEEEFLVFSLEQLGTAIAIGRPGESAPPLGAKRFYISEDQWQDKVQELSADARLVIFRFGKTEGLKWEWDYCLNAIEDISKLLIIVSDSIASDQESVNLIVTSIKEQRNDVLCEEIDCSQTLNIGSIGFIIYFEKNEDNNYLLKQIRKPSGWKQSKLKRAYYWKAFNHICPDSRDYFLAFCVEKDAKGKNALKYYLEPILNRFNIPLYNDEENYYWRYRFVQVKVYFFAILLLNIVLMIIVKIFQI